MLLCCVCTEQTSKYKCPACKIRYCSLVCYKTHKDACNPAPTRTSSNSGKSLDTRPPSDPLCIEDILHEDDLIDKVPEDKLQLLGQSKELQDLLCNPHLRQLLRSIDSAKSKEEAMKAAMQEPLFVEFSDSCLKMVENQVYDLNYE